MGTERQGPVDAPAPSRVPPSLLVVALSAGIVALMAWWTWAVDTGTIGDHHLLDRPVGTAAVLSLLPITELPPHGGYVVGRRSLRVPVAGDPAGLVLGQEISVGGHVGDGVFVEEWRAAAPGRPAKRWLGIVGLAITAGAAIGGLTPTHRGLRCRWPTS